MATTPYVFNSFKGDIMNGSIDLDTDTIKVALCTSSFTPNIDTMTKFSDITNELPATGNYTSGGFTLAGKTVTVNNTTDLAYFDANDVSVASATFTFRTLVLYKSTGTPATSPLICAFVLGADQVYASDPLSIQWDATGIVKLT